MDISTHFAFRHRVFSVEGSYFSARQDGGAPHFATPMGEAMALVGLPALRQEFAIADDSDDGKLLAIVERALKFVKVIRVNDAIPNELLDGTASWSVEDRHRLIAKGRLTLQLIAWVTGKTAKRIDLANIMEELEKPRIKAKVKESIAKLTRHLGLGKDGADEVEKRIETLVHELSYIEGLRERLATILGIEAMVEEAVALCQKRMSVRESANRVPVLLTYAFQKLESEFGLLDQHNQNITDLLKDMDATIKLIRAVRDEIHCTLRIWDDVVDAWYAQSRKPDEDALPSLLAETHRFLAENYPIVHVW